MKVKIKDYDYEIVEEEDGNNVYIDGEEMRLGLCDFINQKIYIHKNIRRERKYKTLVHELTHAFLESYGFIQESYDEEQLCEIMALYSNEINDICDKYFEQRGDK